MIPPVFVWNVATVFFSRLNVTPVGFCDAKPNWASLPMRYQQVCNLKMVICTYFLITWLLNPQSPLKHKELIGCFISKINLKRFSPCKKYFRNSLVQIIHHKLFTAKLSTCVFSRSFLRLIFVPGSQFSSYFYPKLPLAAKHYAVHDNCQTCQRKTSTNVPTAQG